MHPVGVTALPQPPIFPFSSGLLGGGNEGVLGRILPSSNLQALTVVEVCVEGAFSLLLSFGAGPSCVCFDLQLMPTSGQAHPLIALREVEKECFHVPGAVVLAAGTRELLAGLGAT